MEIKGVTVTGMILKYRDVTDSVLKAFYTIYRELGYGFLERVYENAIVIELTELGLRSK
jgi:GxxExxY protein